MVDRADELAFHPAQTVLQNRQAQGAEAERSGIEAPPHRLLGLEEHRRQVFLVGAQHIEREAAGAADHAVAGGIGPHRHHHQGGLKRPLGDPAGGEAVHLLSLGHAANEQAVGNLPKQGLLGGGVEADVGHDSCGAVLERL